MSFKSSETNIRTNHSLPCFKKNVAFFLSIKSGATKGFQCLLNGHSVTPQINCPCFALKSWTVIGPCMINKQLYHVSYSSVEKKKGYNRVLLFSLVIHLLWIPTCPLAVCHYQLSTIEVLSMVMSCIDKPHLLFENRFIYI